jgi:ABC-type methionine transport system ATPase subunit
VGTGRQRVKLTFSAATGDRPLLYQLVKEFNLITNIRQADVTQDSGWVVVDLEGEPAQLERGLKFCRDQGVEVETLEEIS